MIEISEELQKKLKTNIEKLGFFLYFIDQEKIGNNNHLIVYVNKENYDNSISLDDCVLITQEINLFIDDYIDEGYVLEVSSSGVSRRLYELKHFQEVCGHKIKVQLKNKVAGFEDKKVESQLEIVDEEGITIRGVKIKFTNIKKANYIGGNND